MQVALAQAQKAAEKGEVPVGAAIYQHGVLIAQAHNAPISLCDPSAHAEVLVLKEAAKVLGNYRLEDCTLYVSLEPCAMCAGAIFNARVREVVYAARDAKSGAAGSVVNLFADSRINHHARIRGGVLEQQSVALLQDFFNVQRRLHRQAAAHAKSFLREDAVRRSLESLACLASSSLNSSFYVLKAVPGMRLHYLHAEPSSSPSGKTYVCLHGANTCSALFEPVFASLLSSGARVLAPDALGFGASDRFKKSRAYDFSLLMQSLMEWISFMDLKDICFITHDASVIWALLLKVLLPERVVCVLALNPCLKPSVLPESGLGVERDQGVGPHLSALYACLGAWLKRGLLLPHIEAHFAALSSELSASDVRALACSFKEPFERTVFEAFEVLFPSVEQALAGFDLDGEGLQVLRSSQFTSQCLWMNTLPSRLMQDAALSSPASSLLSDFVRSDALEGCGFLSPASFAQLGKRLREGKA
jgi:tRNA(adenine34) deaminase